MTCCPQKAALRVSVFIPQSEEIDKKLEAVESFTQYDRKAYRFKFNNAGEIDKDRQVLGEVVKMAYDRRK